MYCVFNSSGCCKLLSAIFHQSWPWPLTMRHPGGQHRDLCRCRMVDTWKGPCCPLLAPDSALSEEKQNSKHHQSQKADPGSYFILYIHHKRLASLKIWSVEELETLPEGSKPMTSNHQSSGWQRCRKSKHSMILPWKDETGPLSIKHWNCFKANIWEVPERKGEACILPHFLSIQIPSWTDQTDHHDHHHRYSMERKANQSAGGGILHDYRHHHHNYHQHHHSHHHHHHSHQNRHSMQWWWRLTRGSRVVWPEALGAEPSLADVLRLSSDWVGEIRTEKPHREYNMLSVHTQTHETHHDKQHTHTYTHTHTHTHTHTTHDNHSAQKHTLDFTPITVRQNGTKHTEIHRASSRLCHYCVTMAVQPLQWTWCHCTAVGSLTAERDKTHTGNTPCSLYTLPLQHSQLICWRLFRQ